MSSTPKLLAESILEAWSTSDRVTALLIERLPPTLWRAAVPGAPRRTVRMIAAHIHNTRSAWIRTLGRPHGIEVPERVDRNRVTRSQLVRALARSGRGIASLLTLALASGGRIEPTAAYVWRNLPLDAGHVLAYFVAHEGHHRGQIVLVARALGEPLPREVTEGLWHWSRIARTGSFSARGPRRPLR